MPEENQQIPQTPNGVSITPRHGVLFLGAGAFAILGFILSYGYLDHTAQPHTQTAAVAEAVDAFSGVQLVAQSAIVVDTVSGKTLYERNADVQLPLASLTKIPLILTVLEVLSLDETIRIPYDTPPANASMRLHKGELWKVKDVIRFTLIASSNEGAEILAQAADARLRAKYPDAPEGKAALWRMNDLAKQLQLNHTYFLNVSGLDQSVTQAGAYSSARDYALLLAYAAKQQEDILSATTRESLSLSDAEGNTETARNTNEAIGDIPGLILGKTGYTDLAGGNLAVLFDVGPAHPVIAIVLGSTYDGRFADIPHLVERARTSIGSH